MTAAMLRGEGYVLAPERSTSASATVRSMGSRSAIALLTGIVLLASGCGASFGSIAAKQAITQNKLPAKGNTEEQMLQWIGPPNERVRMQDGREHWTYVYSEAEWRYPGLMFIPIVGLFFIRLDTAVWRLSLTFDEQGRLIELETSQASGGSN